MSHWSSWSACPFWFWRFSVILSMVLGLNACTTLSLEPSSSVSSTDIARFAAQLDRAEQALQQDGPSAAAAQLPTQYAHQPVAAQIRYHQLAADIAHRQQDPLASVRELIKLDALLKEESLIVNNQNLIAKRLSGIPKARLMQIPFTLDALGGWIELILIKQSASPTPQRFDNWRQIHLDHPITNPVFNAIRQQSLRKQVNHIAILLPMTGNLAGYGQAIAAGITTRYYQDSSETKPSLQTYDTHQKDVVKLYQQAVADGAHFVIGPLQKEQIQALAAQRQLPVPVLALNRIEQEHPNIYNFGLAPEDEAREVAQRMVNDGIQQVATLTPDNEWGHRLQAAFNQTWKQHNSRPPTELTYSPETTDYATLIKTLSIDKESEFRWQKLQTYLQQPLKFVPSQRQDIDAIFLVATPEHARQWIPQFRYYKLTRPKVYSTSHIYNGIVNPTGNADLEGIYYCDIPWLSPANADTLLPADNAYHRNRLFALGADSYLLFSQLNPAMRLSGLTGLLRLERRQIERSDFNWYKFEQGTSQAIP